MFSVTQVLEPFTDFSKIPPEVLEEAKLRGSMAHGLFASYALCLWIPAVPENCIGYFDSFKRWFDSTVELVVAVEKRLNHPIHRYTGQLDLLCKIKGDEGYALIDHKTPAALQLSWRVQTAAYRELGLLEYPDIFRTGTLRLSKEGRKAKFDEHTTTLAQDFAIFLNCLSAYKFFKGEK